MRILDPVLAPDVSSWCDHIVSKEFQDGGCASVVVGLYPVIDNTGAKVLSPISRQQCLDVVNNSSMVLQAYYWVDITYDPIRQANWVVDTIIKEGLPIKWVWADAEQWWTDWGAWNKAKAGLIPWSQVPVGAPAMISAYFERFNTQLHSRLPQSGVYTNKGFVTSWAPPMDAWLPQYAAWVAHYGRQPKEAIDLTWAQLKEKWLPDYEIVLSAGQKPELVMGHQFTGDRCYLPGSYGKNVGKAFPHGGRLPLDVNVFSKTFIDAIRLNLPPGPPPGPVPGPTTSDYIVLYARINVRAAPSGDATWVRFAAKDEVLKVVNIANGWAQLADGTYVFADYIAKKPTVPPPPPPPAPGPGTGDYVVTPARINVRAAPSGNATWVRFAVKDEVLKVVTIANGWAQLLDGTYVFAGYIVTKPAAPVPPAPTPTPPPPTPLPTPVPPPGPVTVDYVVIYARINVRAKASSDSGWVRFAVKDEVLHVVNVTNGWAQLADGTYVFADYIRKV